MPQGELLAAQRARGSCSRRPVYLFPRGRADSSRPLTSSQIASLISSVQRQLMAARLHLNSSSIHVILTPGASPSWGQSDTGAKPSARLLRHHVSALNAMSDVPILHKAPGTSSGRLGLATTRILRNPYQDRPPRLTFALDESPSSGANPSMAEMDCSPASERLTRLAFDDTSGARSPRGDFPPGVCR